MTRTMRLTLLALVAGVFATAALAAGPTYQLDVNGLACPFCAYGIEKQLNKIEGVETLETDIEAGAVMVTMQDGHTLTESRARQAVDQAGFTLGGFEEIGSAADGDPQ